MKITKRVPEEAYAFTEIQFDSLEEYIKQYPEFVKSYLKVKRAVDTIKKNQEEPF